MADKELEKEKYTAFLAEVSDILGLGKPVDILKLCAITDGFIRPYQERIAELEKAIERMRCCENCKYTSYWGNELHCNYGMKEALQEDKLVECKNMDKWEIKEK